MHPQGIAVPSKLVRPKWSKPVGKQAAILVLHGSGGLLKTPKDKGGEQPCLPEMESQYKMWSDRLAKLGYTVLLPSSYSARGFCDKHDDIKRMPKTFDDKPEQILSRIYDTDVAARYLCTLPEVDCERLGVMGFSQGGTMTMLALHWQTEHAVEYFRATKAKQIDFEIPDVPPGRPDFQVGIAYYPGCGFDGVVPLSTGKSAKQENKFLPTAPLTVLHGGKDPLIKQCSTKHGTGARQVQSKQVAGELKIADPYEITVYEQAEHGFDHAGEKGKGGSPNKQAMEAALAVTLAQLAEHLN
jgi:dienelactone hydrolase